jgi:hypothetical protein
MASKLTDTCSVSLFLELTVDELQHYLAVRDLTTSDTKLDLAARALVAEEQKIQPKAGLKQLQAELSQEYKDLL